jgi:IrrE N-terminal-like domain
MRFIKPHIENIAKGFWAQTDQKSMPPFDISGTVNLLFPIDIINLSELSLRKVEQWLLQRNIHINVDANDRHLHGFILIYKGSGFIFINGTDSEEERRYTIAHEASHFILDYKIPRDQIIEKMGLQIQDVLDGVRDATEYERIDGLLNSINIRPFTHLLEKEGDGSFESIQIFNAENNADLLALELLAPNSKVIKETLAGKESISFYEFEKKCYEILIQKYKLPNSIAKQYSTTLSYSITGGPSIMTKLGF